MPSRNRTTSNGKSDSASPAKPGNQSAESAAEPPPGATLSLPFLSAEVAIPGPGVSVKAGPINLSLPTRYLYYGGVGALAVAGAVEWPIAGALAATGLVVNRMRKPATTEQAETTETGAQPTPA